MKIVQFILACGRSRLVRSGKDKDILASRHNGTFIKTTSALLGILAITLGLAVQVQAQSFLTNGLVVYYPFNGNANDASGNGNDGIVDGATLTADRFRDANSAYYFNGVSSDILVPETLFGPTAEAVTVSVWITFDSGPYWVNTHPYEKSSINGEMAIAVQSNYVFFQIHSASQGWIGASAPLLTNSTMHMVGVYQKGQSLSLYTNGVLAANMAVPDENLYVSGFPLISALGSYHYTGGPYEWFRGTLDDFRVYTRALSASEVQQLYAYESVPPSCSPHSATATARLDNGFVVGATITDGGCGYTNTPTVRIIGGGGSGAEAVAVVTNEVVIAVTVLDAGSGYTNMPVIVIEPPFIEQPRMGIAAMSLLSFTNLAVGTNYQLQSFFENTWSNLGAAFTAAGPTFTQYVSGTADPNGYRLAISPVPLQAFATAQLVNGFVVGATVTSGGSGYVTTPAVTIVGGGGTNATAIAQSSGGVVTNITITDAGIGYTNTPTVEIDPPPVAAVSPTTVLPMMRVDSANLAPYDNYQIQFMPTLGGAWGNWNGGLFSPTDVTNSQYLFITNGVGFFRMEYVP
jgi:hypothetical protein